MNKADFIAIIRKKRVREADDPTKESDFSFHGKPVDPYKVERFIKRTKQEELENLLKNGSKTPEHLQCYTPCASPRSESPMSLQLFQGYPSRPVSPKLDNGRLPRAEVADAAQFLIGSNKPLPTYEQQASLQPAHEEFKSLFDEFRDGGDPKYNYPTPGIDRTLPLRSFPGTMLQRYGGSPSPDFVTSITGWTSLALLYSQLSSDYTEVFITLAVFLLPLSDAKRGICSLLVMGSSLSPTQTERPLGSRYMDERTRRYAKYSIDIFSCSKCIAASVALTSPSGTLRRERLNLPARAGDDSSDESHEAGTAMIYMFFRWGQGKVAAEILIKCPVICGECLAYTTRAAGQ